MDHIHSNTIEDVRTSGRHLSLEERGMIQALHRQGLSLRNIVAAVRCAHTTVFNDGTEIGHWEVDTVVGRRTGREAVVFTAVEKVTRNYIAIRIPGRTCAGVEAALAQLQELYGTERFSQIFKTMTADNGPEFETLSQFECLGTKMYFTHPYSSWERAQNERHNGLLRDFIPKGMSMERFSDEDVLNIADTLNQRPRRVLGYHTPSELFDAFLDEVYAIKCIS